MEHVVYMNLKEFILKSQLHVPRWRGSWILSSCTSVVYGIVGGVFADHLNIEIQMAYVALYNIFKKEIQQGGQTRFLN